MRTTRAILICVAVLATQASAFVVDGNLSDWGVTVADNNHSIFNFTPNSGIVGWHVEDQDDLAGDGGYLGPNNGGQNYDAEMMAVAISHGKYFISLVTGQRNDNGFERFGPGDIRIETAHGTFGLEVGGGRGNKPGFSGPIYEAGLGSTYTLNGSGYTSQYADAAVKQTTGSIWSGVTWILDPIAPQEAVQFAIGNTSQYVGLADYVYTRDSATTQHAVIELSMEMSLFQNNPIQSVHWRPSCGNDQLDVIVPEPATLLLLGLGCLAFGRRAQGRPVA